MHIFPTYIYDTKTLVKLFFNLSSLNIREQNKISIYLPEIVSLAPFSVVLTSTFVFISELSARSE